MGLTWCRERIEQAQNSKSPVDRILVCCSNVIKPKSSYSHSQGKVVNDFVYKGMRSKDFGISQPVPIHAVPPRARPRMQKNADWQSCTLTVQNSDDKPPVPPPRKKRKGRINSMEVLKNELPELHSPSYVKYSDNLLNKAFVDAEANDTYETDVLRPLEKSYYRERIRCDRFGKLSGHRARKIKNESHPNDAKEKRVKNDNEKRTEQKIKHVSTVSLPNYNELIKPSRKVSTDVENGDDKTGNQSVGLKHSRRNSSTISLPGEGSNSILSSLSEATIHRLEAYMKKCRSFGTLKPQQLLEKLEEFHKTHRSASESSDSWSGLDDWDLGVIEWCDSEQQAPPLTPKSTIPSKQSTFFTTTERLKQEETKEEEKDKEAKPTTIEEPTQETEGSPTEKTSIFQICESVMEGVPIEWFLDPSLRPLAIMPPPVVSEDTKTPPPSPESESQKEAEIESEEHSSLLNILRQFKDDENGELEYEVNIGEIVNETATFETVGKDSMVFEEVDVKIPLRDMLNPFLPIKNRSYSVAEEQPRAIKDELLKLKSPSIDFESSGHLIEELQSNNEEIEEELFQKPNELIKVLRKESLRQSLPEDAFEAYVNKKKPSLKESLNDFLGFQEEKKTTCDGDAEKTSKDEKGNNVKEEKKDKENEEAHSPPAPPLFPITINPPSDETNTPVPHSLVKTDNKPNV